jgi:hypothetical protein
MPKKTVVNLVKQDLITATFGLGLDIFRGLRSDQIFDLLKK